MAERRYATRPSRCCSIRSACSRRPKAPPTPSGNSCNAGSPSRAPASRPATPRGTAFSSNWKPNASGPRPGASAAGNDRREWDGQRPVSNRRSPSCGSRSPPSPPRQRLRRGSRRRRARCPGTENRRLRDTCHSLVRSSAQAAEAGRLRVEWNASQVQLEEARRELRQSLDDRDRERKEFEAELAGPRRAPECPRAGRPRPRAPAPPLAPRPFPETQLDDRIRALRQHLREIHDDEQKERAQNRFTARLSRLWRHTSPTH